MSHCHFLFSGNQPGKENNQSESIEHNQRSCQKVTETLKYPVTKSAVKLLEVIQEKKAS